MRLLYEMAFAIIYILSALILMQAFSTYDRMATGHSGWANKTIWEAQTE